MSEKTNEELYESLKDQALSFNILMDWLQKARKDQKMLNKTSL